MNDPQSHRVVAPGLCVLAEIVRRIDQIHPPAQMVQQLLQHPPLHRVLHPLRRRRQQSRKGVRRPVQGILNYDFTFLAILLWPCREEEETLRRGCIAHPLGKRDYYPGNRALELAADESVILPTAFSPAGRRLSPQQGPGQTQALRTGAALAPAETTATE